MPVALNSESGIELLTGGVAQPSIDPFSIGTHSDRNPTVDGASDDDNADGAEPSVDDGYESDTDPFGQFAAGGHGNE